MSTNFFRSCIKLNFLRRDIVIYNDRVKYTGIPPKKPGFIRAVQKIAQEFSPNVEFERIRSTNHS